MLCAAGGQIRAHVIVTVLGAHIHVQLLCEQARSEGKCVRALVVINPGNPTGQILTRDNQVNHPQCPPS